MKNGWRGSVTVEAAILYPMLLTVTFLLVQVTLRQYQAVGVQAARLYNAVVTERKMQTPDIIRAAGTAFDFFER